MKKSRALDEILDVREETDVVTPTLACTREELFVRWYDAYRGDLRDGLIAKFGRRARNEADDAANEAFLRLHKALVRGAQIEHPEAWLWTVARNVMLNEIKRAGFEDAQRRGVEWLKSAPVLTPEQVLAEKQKILAVRQALSTLSETERACFELRASGLKAGAIAKELGLERRRVPEIIARVVRKTAEKNR